MGCVHLHRILEDNYLIFWLVDYWRWQLVVVVFLEDARTFRVQKLERFCGATHQDVVAEESNSDSGNLRVDSSVDVHLATLVVGEGDLDDTFSGLITQLAELGILVQPSWNGQIKTQLSRGLLDLVKELLLLLFEQHFALVLAIRTRAVCQLNFQGARKAVLDYERWCEHEVVNLRVEGLDFPQD